MEKPKEGSPLWGAPSQAEGRAPQRALFSAQQLKGLASGTTKQKRSKAFGRQLWWLKDREQQLQLHVAWDAGAYSLAGYPAKHHPSQHLKAARPIYLHADGKQPRSLGECEAMLEARKPTKTALLTVLKYKGLLAAAAAAT